MSEITKDFEPKIDFSPDKAGGGGGAIRRTPEQRREVVRDDSIHRVGNPYAFKRRRTRQGVGEEDMPGIIESLKRLTGWKPPQEEEQ